LLVINDDGGVRSTGRSLHSPEDHQ
jgi:hypothetical protein